MNIYEEEKQACHESAIDIRRDPNYQYGYYQGFAEGYHKALEEMKDMLHGKVQMPQIVLNIDESNKKWVEDLLNKQK